MKHFKLKDPGSAITLYRYADGNVCRNTADSACHARTGYRSCHFFKYFYCEYDSAVCGKHNLSHFDLSERTNKILKKLDHCMIFVLIAGSYTPICLIVLHDRTGLMLLALVWSIAILGIIFKLCWVTCPKWVSSVLYIAMGWVCVLAFTQILNSLPAAAFNWLLAGGIIYTVGGIIYALKLPIFNAHHKYFGSHEIFHLFVMAGSICHFIMMFEYVAVLPLA